VKGCAWVEFDGYVDKNLDPSTLSENYQLVLV
jgi:hypothetical protein